MRFDFVSPYCILDTSSGAAVSMRLLLKLLQQRGLCCGSFSGNILDYNHGHDFDYKIKEMKWEECVRAGDKRIKTIRDGNVLHEIYTFPSAERNLLSWCDVNEFLGEVKNYLKTNKPEYIILFGWLGTEQRIVAMAKAMGIGVLFYLANANYSDVSFSREVDEVLVTSYYLANNYKQFGVNCQLLRDPMSRMDHLSEGRDARYITMINPIPSKGLALFLCLASMVSTIKKDTQFLFVECRSRVDDLIQNGLELPKHVDWTIMPNQIDMRKVYRQTKLLVYPSYVREASGRCIVEAHMNEIPVLTADIGGIKENYCGGGPLLPISTRLLSCHNLTPTFNEIVPWVTECLRLISSPRDYSEAKSRALMAYNQFVSQDSVGALIERAHARIA